jgi:hypothetical protein
VGLSGDTTGHKVQARIVKTVSLIFSRAVKRKCVGCVIKRILDSRRKNLVENSDSRLYREEAGEMEVSRARKTAIGAIRGGAFASILVAKCA